jgi:hypothetical protein
MNNTILDEASLNRLVPSIFAQAKAEHRSERYRFIPTINVVHGLRQAGFFPVAAMQSRTRVEGKQNFAKHILRFRHENNLDLQKGDILPEIVLVNSHDGSSSYQLRAGLYRCVCSNGLIDGDEKFCRKVRHSGDVITQVVESANDLIELVPLSFKKAHEWAQIELKPEHKEIFAESAALLKWDIEDSPIAPDKLLKPRRFQDQKNDLWTTFNIVQENVMRGRTRYNLEDGHRQRTRPVNSVDGNVKLNSALWLLTEKMAQLVA